MNSLNDPLDTEEKTVVQPVLPNVDKSESRLKWDDAAKEEGVDHTVVVPSPGGKRGSVKPPPIPMARSAQESPSLMVGDLCSQGVNPVTAAANSLLSILVKLRYSASHRRVGTLHQQLTQQIQQFETRCRSRDVKQDHLITARYLLCACIDEAILNTPWGVESGWAQRPLLSIFHRETTGGEKVFQIIHKLMESPSRNIELLELAFICLKMGFEGKYRLDNRGREKLDQLADELYQMIRRVRGDLEQPLSSGRKRSSKRSNALFQYMPMWVVASLFGVVLLLSFSSFKYWLVRLEAPVIEAIQSASLASDPLQRID